MSKELRAEFEAWWRTYPRRIGKLAAIREYERARKQASAEELLAGIERYKRNKPEYADYCHPRTWLHQGRWLDEDVPPASAGRVSRRPAWAQEGEP